jgi:uncharacterized protein
MKWFCLLLPLAAAACGSSQARPGPVEQPKRKSESVAMPEGYTAVHVAGVIPTEDGGAAVLVTDEKEQVVLPIMVGGTEALSIQLRLEGRSHPRPLTHDLLESILGSMGGTIVKVHIDDLRDGVFFGSVFVRQDDWVFKVDARPSDAMALAVGNKVPVYVARRVLDEGGVKREDLEQRRVMPPSGGEYSELRRTP